MSQTGNNQEIVGASPQARKIKWIVTALLLAVAVAVVMSLPHGYSDDLSRIGKGKMAMVLVRDKNATQSFDLMNALDSVRNRYAEKVEFLLTDFDTPQGRAFIEANQAARATLVVFDADGNRLKVLRAPQTAASLQQEIVAASSGGNP
jgi:hypothetical protein